jgi:hypothetical protein
MLSIATIVVAVNVTKFGGHAGSMRLPILDALASDVPLWPKYVGILVVVHLDTLFVCLVRGVTDAFRLLNDELERNFSSHTTPAAVGLHNNNGMGENVYGNNNVEHVGMRRRSMVEAGLGATPGSNGCNGGYLFTDDICRALSPTVSPTVLLL